MEAPIYLLTENDGVPIPDTTWILDVSHDISYRFHHTNNQVILAIVNHDDIDLLLDDVKQCAIYTQRIGLLCTVIEQEDSDNFTAITLKVGHRVYLETFSSVEDTRKITVEYTPVSEDLLPEEEGQMSDDFDQLVGLITSSPSVFGKEMADAVAQADWLPVQMNLIAHYALTDFRSRSEYIQEERNIIRFNSILDAVSNWSEKNQNQPKAVKKTNKTRVHNADSIKARFEQLNIATDIKDHLNREISKLDSLPKSSTQHSMVLDYMSWILDVPWNNYSRKEPNLNNFIDQLSETHYGLDQVKKHLLEHMTIEKIKGTSTGSILCFVGSPGTGKTSIAKQIAIASNRHLARVALGGLSDEAEIRGHRRTYLGSRPGRLIVGLKQAGTLDPLFLLDEIDKISNSGRGDPSAALLEVLDKEQNDHFIDRYLEVPVDLSRAMFVCTANYEEQIPEALRDRMEFIYFPEYKRDERRVIIEQYLIPKAIKQLSLEQLDISISADAISELVNTTQIRVIEKKLHKLMRMAAVDIVVYGKSQVQVDKPYLKRLPNSKNTSKTIGFTP